MQLLEGDRIGYKCLFLSCTSLKKKELYKVLSNYLNNVIKIIEIYYVHYIELSRSLTIAMPI